MFFMKSVSLQLVLHDIVQVEISKQKVDSLYIPPILVYYMANLPIIMSLSSVVFFFFF
jgi:hypothetical protein